MQNLLTSAFAGAMLTLVVSGSANAAPKGKPIEVCATTDIGITAIACSGFYEGNLLSNSSKNILAQKAGLSAIGFNWDGNFSTIEKIASLEGSHTADFATILNGISYVGFHFGGGQGGPGNATAFYKLDAGVNLDTLHLNYNASSGAVLYSTGAAPIPTDSTVPEPAAWMLLIAGFGLVGASMRRRSIIVVTA